MFKRGKRIPEKHGRMYTLPDRNRRPRRDEFITGAPTIDKHGCRHIGSLREVWFEKHQKCVIPKQLSPEEFEELGLEYGIDYSPYRGDYRDEDPSDEVTPPPVPVVEGPDMWGLDGEKVGADIWGRDGEKVGADVWGRDGSDRDEHGCIRSAGYRWSEKHKQCIQPWEWPKEPNDPAPEDPNDPDPYDVPMEYADEYTAVDIPSSIPVEDEPKKKFWTGGKIAAASVAGGAAVAALSLVAYRNLTSRSEGDGSRGDLPVSNRIKTSTPGAFSSFFTPKIPTMSDIASLDSQKPERPLNVNRGMRQLFNAPKSMPLPLYRP
jgi:hypothetical protein